MGGSFPYIQILGSSIFHWLNIGFVFGLVKIRFERVCNWQSCLLSSDVQWFSHALFIVCGQQLLMLKVFLQRLVPFVILVFPVSHAQVRLKVRNAQYALRCPPLLSAVLFANTKPTFWFSILELFLLLQSNTYFCLLEIVDRERGKMKHFAQCRG